MFNRRFLLAALPASFILPPLTYAKTVHKLTVGKAELTIFSDGWMSNAVSNSLAHKSAEEIDAVFKLTKSQPSKGGQINIVLIKIGAELILIDCGANSNFTPQIGLLPKRLEEAGIELDSITKVIFTHGHPDHLWGAIDEFNTPMFPKAKHIISKIERDYWLNPNTVASLPEAMKSFGVGSARVLKELEPVLSTANADEKLADGLFYKASYGHSPGHMCVRLESEGKQLLIIGDALVHNIFSFAKPEWHWGSDADQALGAKTRLSLLDELAVDKINLLGYHLPFPGIGYVEKKAYGYSFIQ